MKAIMLMLALTMLCASSVTAKTSIDKDVGVQVSITNNPDIENVVVITTADYCWRYKCCQPAEISTTIVQLPIQAEKPVMNDRYTISYKSKYCKTWDRYGNFKFPS